MNCRLFLLCTILSALYLSVYGQNQSTSKVVIKIDSIVASIKKQKTFILQNCDSIRGLTGHKDYKCFNYFFEDSSMKKLVKVSVSFNDCAENLCFYYYANKVIKLDHYSVIDCKQQSKWSVYMEDDKEIYTKGNRGNIRTNEVESGYYFLTLAFDYVKTNEIFKQFPHLIVVTSEPRRCF